MALHRLVPMQSLGGGNPTPAAKFLSKLRKLIEVG